MKIGKKKKKEKNKKKKVTKKGKAKAKAKARQRQSKRMIVHNSALFAELQQDALDAAVLQGEAPLEGGGEEDGYEEEFHPDQGEDGQQEHSAAV